MQKRRFNSTAEIFDLLQRKAVVIIVLPGTIFDSVPFLRRKVVGVDVHGEAVYVESGWGRSTFQVNATQYEYEVVERPTGFSCP